MRILVLVLTLLVAVSASGISSAIAASDGADCCDDGGDRDGRQPPSDQRCPPFCHACACAPLFEAPRLEVPRTVMLAPARATTFVLATEPAPGPPGPGVFHPPR